jgi:Fe(II)/alpha-ketoglutarate-dependent arginine beta-hydroxylase
LDDVMARALTSAESEGLIAAAAAARAGRASPADPAFYDDLEPFVGGVPESLRATVAHYRADGPSSLVLSGVPVDAARCGPTPLSWQEAVPDGRQEQEEAQLALLAALLGEPFAWRTIQLGRMVQNLVPVDGEQQAQSGHGAVELDWHSEDGFHESRCRYLVLLGIRNPDGVPTTVGCIRGVELTARQRAVLAQPRFLIRPDPEHLRQLAATAPGSAALLDAQERHDHPEPVAILSGPPDDPHLRIDPPYTTTVPGDDEAAEAVAAVVAELDRLQRDVVVGAGEVLVLDNYRAVHGRRAFRPRFDGTDRWLKRISVREPVGASTGRVL